MNMLTNYLVLMGQKYRNSVWSSNVLEACTSKNFEVWTYMLWYCCVVQLYVSVHNVKRLWKTGLTESLKYNKISIRCHSQDPFDTTLAWSCLPIRNMLTSCHPPNMSHNQSFHTPLVTHHNMPLNTTWHSLSDATYQTSHSPAVTFSAMLLDVILL